MYKIQESTVGKSLLVVDDSATMRKIITRSIRKAGLSVSVGIWLSRSIANEYKIMIESQAELESKTVDLTLEAFSTFAEDIGTMFDTEVSVVQTDIATGSIKDLKNTYKNLAAVCSVRSEGAVNGQFHIVFDKDRKSVV